MSDAPLTVGGWTLGRVFKKMRTDLDLTTTQVAKALKVSQPTVSRIESGRHRLTPNQFGVLCKLYKVAREDERELDRARIDVQQPDWRQEYSTVLDGPLGDVLGLETGASRFRVLKTSFYPAMLQTEDYAAAVLREMPFTRESEVSRRVELRMRRKKAFQSGSQKLIALASFAVVEQEIGGREVAAGQVRNVLNSIEQENIRFRVLAPSSGGHPGHGTDCTIMDFPDAVGLPTVVWCENLVSSLIYEQPKKVETFTTSFDMAWPHALDEAETFEYLKSVEKKMSRVNG